MLFPSFSYSFLFLFIPLLPSLFSLFYSLFPSASLFILSVMVLSYSEPAWCVHIGLAMHLPLESNCYVVLLY